jgi:hypothetical protein
MDTEDWLYMVRARAIGKNFDVDQVGFVPWKGTVDVTALTGPVWYFDVGAVQRLSLFAGPIASYEDADLYTDLAGAVGLNANFRSNWGFEMSAVVGRSKDQSVLYAASEYSLGAWCEISPRWNGYLHAGYSRSYNFSRGYLGRTVALNGEVEWKMLDVLEIGTSYGIFVEATPEGNVEEITYNARPFFSFTPWNNINIRTYLDILYLRSTQSPEQAIFGFLLSYNFLPKSWIYLAINEVQNRQAFADAAGTPLPPRLGTTDRAAVLKIKYLFSL